MKIKTISDVHCEFHDDKGRKFAKTLPVEDVDVLVVAGDLGTVDTLHDVIKILCTRVPHVVYVTGNHEYYHSNRAVINRALQKISKRCKNFHWLNNSDVVIDSQRFIGATMWFPDNPGNWAWEKQMTDFRAIQGFKRWVYDENTATQKFLVENVRHGDVVVTHHLPTRLSIHSKFKGSELNRFFVCDMSDLIVLSKPVLWLHGHTHESCDYMIGDTKVLCNPYGYRHEDHGLLNLKFDPSHIVEV